MTGRRLADVVPYLPGALMPLLFLGPMVLRDEIPNACDPITQAYPYHVHLAREVARGTLPLFNPWQMGGTSFAGNVQASIFYPPRLVAAAICGERGFLLLLLAHVVAASVGATRLAGLLGCGGPGRAAAGLLFSCGGFLLGKLVLPPILLTAALLPWVLASVESVLSRAARGVGLGVAAGLALASGHPQTSLAVVASGAAYALLRAAPASVRLQGRGAPLLKGVGVVLAGLFVAGAFTLGSAGAPLWSPLRVYPWLLLFLVLVATVALRGGASLRARPVPHEALARLLAALLLAAVLSCTQLLPVLEHLSESRPPERPESADGFAILEDRVGLFLDALHGRRGDAEETLFLGPLPWILAAGALLGPDRTGRMAMALLAAAGYTVAAGPSVLRTLLPLVPGVNLFPGLGRYLVVPALALPLLAAMGVDRIARRSSRLAWVAVIAVGLPLPFGAVPYLPSTSRRALHERSPLAPAPRFEPARRFALDRDPPFFGLRFDRPELRTLGFPNLSILSAEEDLQGYDPVHGWPITWLEEAVHGWGEWPGRDRYHFVVMQPARGRRKGAEELLRLMGARHVVAHPRARAPRGYRLARESPEGSVWEMADALPRAFQPARLHVEADPRKALALLASGLDPGQDAIVDDPVLVRHVAAAPAALVTGRSACGRLDVAGPVQGFTVVTELFSRAWQARADRVPIPIHRADGVALGVVCPPGTRTLELAYLPRSVLVGLFVSLMGVTAAIVGAMRPIPSGVRRGDNPVPLLRGR